MNMHNAIIIFFITGSSKFQFVRDEQNSDLLMSQYNK